MAYMNTTTHTTAPAKAKRTCIYLEACDKQAIAAIRAHYGLLSDASAIRLALRLWHAAELPSMTERHGTGGAE